MNKATILLMNWLMILRMVFSELNGSTSIDVFRRNIQKIYVDKMIELLKPGTTLVRSVPVG
jgi:hypothetical protein